MNDTIFQIPAILNKYESKVNGAVKFTFTSQDGVDTALLAKLISFIDNLGYLNFAVRQIEAADLINLPEPDKTKYDKGKTPAQRLRAVIYLVFKEKGGDDTEFPAYYDKAMETLIQQVKGKLE
jgi:hypothetical protein